MLKIKALMEEIVRRLLLALLLVTPLCHADVWFYQDKHGVMHFAQEKQGKDWKLLMRTPKQPKAKPTPKITHKKKYKDIVQRSAERHQLDPALVHAVIWAESNYRHKAVSRAGAMGLMQLMPATAERFNVDDPFDPSQNIEAGSRYLRWLLNEFNSLQLALAAYNSGENTVKRYGFAIPPYPETQNYVAKVIERYKANLAL